MEGTLAEIRCFAGDFAPQAWAFCNGQLLPIQPNQALFSLLGTTYGGDGRNTFGLPNLNGRAPVGAGQGPGFSSRYAGQMGGQQGVTLNPDQLPSHSHVPTTGFAIACSNNPGESTFPEATVPGASRTNLYSNMADATMVQQPVHVQIQPSGNNMSHENMPPFLGMNYIICVQGLYPPRN